MSLIGSKATITKQLRHPRGKQRRHPLTTELVSSQCALTIRLSSSTQLRSSTKFYRRTTGHTRAGSDDTERGDRQRPSTTYPTEHKRTAGYLQTQAEGRVRRRGDRRAEPPDSRAAGCRAANRYAKQMPTQAPTQALARLGKFTGSRRNCVRWVHQSLSVGVQAWEF